MVVDTTLVVDPRRPGCLDVQRSPPKGIVAGEQKTFVGRLLGGHWLRRIKVQDSDQWCDAPSAGQEKPPEWPTRGWYCVY